VLEYRQRPPKPRRVVPLYRRTLSVCLLTAGTVLGLWWWLMLTPIERDRSDLAALIVMLILWGLLIR
jgi:hypothetical protein